MQIGPKHATISSMTFQALFFYRKQDFKLKQNIKFCICYPCGYWQNLTFFPFLCGSQTAQTVLVVVVVFCLSWLPHHVVHLWVEFGTFPLNQASFVLRVAAHCLAYSNSSVNPVIYAFLSENFRKAYKQVFKCQIRTSDSPLNDIKDIRSKADTPPSTNCTNVWLFLFLSHGYRESCNIPHKRC